MRLSGLDVTVVGTYTYEETKYGIFQLLPSLSAVVNADAGSVDAPPIISVPVFTIHQH